MPAAAKELGISERTAYRYKEYQASVIIKCKGTVDALPETERLEKMLNDMIDGSGCLESPLFWGHTDTEEIEQ